MGRGRWGCADTTLSGLSRESAGGEMAGEEQGDIDLFINKASAFPLVIIPGFT